jgi:hypothetical protein
LEARDFIVAPLLLMIVYAAAYFIRPFVTNEITRKYFFPALTVRITGALAVGFVYQFYYHGGDTFAYHTYGSRVIWEAFMDDPQKGIALLLSDGEYTGSLYKYSSRIWYFRDPASFFVIRVASVFDLLTFSSYCGTAILFAVFAFIGAWMLFQTFVKLYPDLHRWIAISVLFLPTVVFWGSGIFKDSLTLAALGMATYAFHRVFIEKRIKVLSFALLLLSFWILFSIKKYMLLSFLPALLLWWFAKQLFSVRSLMLRIMLIPFVSVIAFSLVYLAILKVGEDDSRYNFLKLAETAKITAYDIRYGWGARTGEGSGYTLGELDGTWKSILKLAPQAVNVTLFRPYLWEAGNPLMLLSAVEALVVLLLTVFVIVRVKSKLFKYIQKPDILFCLIFSLIFAFAVGVSTFNFGTLSRYKIPMMPFYFLALALIYNSWKSERKLAELDSTE